ncbi:MAG: alpha-2-macroglobulin family protein [Patescibacteria group bacterium]
MTSPLLPKNREDFREEPLSHLFELDSRYKEIKQRGLTDLLQQTHPKKSFKEIVSNFFSSYRFVFGLGFATSGILVGLLVAFLLVQYGPNNFGTINNIGGGINVSAAEIEIVAEKQTKLGVETDTKFIVNTTKPIQSSDLRDNLSITPDTSYDIKQNSDQSFEIIPASELEEGQIYEFNLKTTTESQSSFQNSNLKWAFQTKDKFRVVQTIPRDQATLVPQDTGIEIKLNTESYEDLEANFSISPNVKGKFEKSGKITSFLPEEELLPATIYTIKISSTLSLTDQSTNLGQDYIFRFETNDSSDNSTFLNIGTSFMEVEPSETVRLPISTDSNVSSTKVSIYSFKDQAQIDDALNKYLSGVEEWSRFSQSSDFYTVANMNQIATGEAKIQGSGSYYQKYFQLPIELESGIYVVEAKVQNQSAQVLIQSTSLAGHLTETTTGSLLWLKDKLNQQPLVGANIKTSLSNQNIKSNEQGIANLERSSKEQNHYYKITSDERQLYIPIVRGGYIGYMGRTDLNTRNSKYWSHLYTDLGAYRPNDTMNFWGFIQARDGSTLPEKLTIEIFDDDYGYSKFGNDERIINSKEVRLDAGTFNSEIELGNLEPDYYYTRIVDEQGHIIRQNSFEVVNYTKPTYTTELNTDKEAYFAGEPVKVNGILSFYEGTPVVDTKLSLITSSESKQIQTDQMGNYQATITFPKQDVYRTYLDTRSVKLYTEFSAESELRSYKEVKVFNYRTNVDIDSDIKDSVARIKLKLNQIDITKKPTGKIAETSDYLGQAITDKNVKINLKPYKLNQVETGQYYDFKSKKMVKTYNTERQYLQPINYNNLKTNENGEILLEFNSPDNTYYDVSYELTDTDGSQININSDIYPRYYSSDKEYYNLEMDYTRQYSLGEEVEVEFVSNERFEEEQSAENFLFLRYHNGLYDYTTQKEPKYSFEYIKELVPNVGVEAVYYDGQKFNSSSLENINYKTSDKKLNIELSTDKAEYQPRDKVLLNAKITDSNGQPVKAKTNIAVVNQAALAYNKNESTVLSNIYRPVPSGQNYTYSTHTSFSRSTGGVGDGGLIEQLVRDRFMDTAIFKTIESDQNGELTTEFTVPDNLTSWRVTAEAISNDLGAGSNTFSFSVKKPFFATSVANQTYLTSDKPKIKLRAFGSELKSQDEVKFNLESNTLQISPKSIMTNGSNPVETRLENLPIGKHELKITARSGEYVDSYIRSLEVLNSYTKKAVINSYDFEPSIEIQGSQTENTEIIFSNQGAARYLSALESIANNSGQRLDQKLPKQISIKLLNQYFNNNYSLESTDYKLYQSEVDRGIAIYPYADSDLEKTIWSLSLAKEEFDTSIVKNYLEEIIDDKEESRERKILALTGLSYLDNSLLQEAQNLAKIDDLNPTEKLYTALILSNLGDKENGRTLYQEIIRDYSMEKDDTSRLNLGKTEDEIIRHSILGAVVGAHLQETEAEKLFNYTLENSTERDIISLQQARYLQISLPNLSNQDVEFSFEYKRSRQNIRLNNNQIHRLELNNEELNNLEIEVENDKLGIVSKYSTELQEQTNNPDLFISRKYYVNGQPTTTFTDGQLVKIILDYNIKKQDNKGCYTISDYLPSGLKPSTQVPLYNYLGLTNSSLSPYQTDQQKVSFCVTTETERPIIYYARVISKGEFKADPAIIQSTQNPSELSLSEGSKVTIE